LTSLPTPPLENRTRPFDFMRSRRSRTPCCPERVKASTIAWRSSGVESFSMEMVTSCRLSSRTMRLASSA
jgi:hypothetical protein